MKRKWIRRTELKEFEMQRVQVLRAARAQRPNLWPRIKRAFQSVIEFFRKIGAVIAKTATAVAEFIARAVPVIEHQQHQQFAVGISQLIERKQGDGPLGAPVGLTPLPMLPSLTGFAVIGEPL